MHQDFSERLSTFNAFAVEYLVVGAHALAAHGHIRATKDLDVGVRPSQENAARTLRSLASFGAALHDLTKATSRRPERSSRSAFRRFVST